MNSGLFDFLVTRRSIKPDHLSGPGPTREELNRILTAGSRVPDHKKLTPWRYIIFEGEARTRAGEIFAEACRKEEAAPPSPVRLELERGRFLRAPTVIAVVSSARAKAPAPEWEQVLSSGALCYNTCLAANALGFATCWITEWVAYSPSVKAALGLQEHERIAGFLYLGRVSEKPDERDRPKLEDIVSYWPE
jgi:nitroreductase